MVKTWYPNVDNNDEISLLSVLDNSTQRRSGPWKPTVPYQSRTFRPIHNSDHDNKIMHKDNKNRIHVSQQILPFCKLTVTT